VWRRKRTSQRRHRWRYFHRVASSRVPPWM